MTRQEFTGRSISSAPGGRRHSPSPSQFVNEVVRRPQHRRVQLHARPSWVRIAPFEVPVVDDGLAVSEGLGILLAEVVPVATAVLLGRGVTGVDVENGTCDEG